MKMSQGGWGGGLDHLWLLQLLPDLPEGRGGEPPEGGGGGGQGASLAPQPGSRDGLEM